MEYPTVQFRLNQVLDQWTAKEFEAGTSDSVLEFYKLNIGELEKFTTTAKEDWDKVAPLFFQATSRLFKNHPWPEGGYIGYASMFDCNPRFLNNKTFQVYYKYRAGSNYVTAHELLHFMFYDYAIKNHPGLFEGKDTESGTFWDVAEIFNAVVLHTVMFSKIHNAKEQVVYPEHQKFVQDLEGQHEEVTDVDEFILKIYNLVKSKRYDQSYYF